MKASGSPPDLMTLIDEVAAASGVSADEIIGSVEVAAGLAASESVGAPVLVRLDRETGRFHQTASGSDESEEAGPAQGTANLRQLARPILGAARQELEERLKASRMLAGGERFRNRVGKLETGRVVGREGGDLIVDLGASRARLPAREQSRHEVFNPDDMVRAVVVAVRPEEPPVILSRIAPAVVAGALEREAPEVRSGAVTVRGVARFPGVRAKVAVSSDSREVDPVACCLGPGGSRIRAVSRELRGERVDVVRWHPDPRVFARHALRPAEVLSVESDPEGRGGPGGLLVWVTGEELPRALGKRGQNVRLAADLLGVSLEISQREGSGHPPLRTDRQVASGSGRRDPGTPGNRFRRRPERTGDDRRRKPGSRRHPGGSRRHREKASTSDSLPRASDSREAGGAFRAGPPADSKDSRETKARTD